MQLSKPQIDLLIKTKDQFMAQGDYGTNDQSDCVLRGPDNMACFIGQMIKDEFYQPFMEDHPTPTSPQARALLEALKVSNPGIEFNEDFCSTLAEMQMLHDDMAQADKPLEEFEAVFTLKLEALTREH